MKEDAIVVKNSILELITQANSLIPAELVPNLPAIEYNSEVPKFHDFESKIWNIGEEIGQILAKYPFLRKDIEIQKGFVEISTNQNAKRGRQSFIMLLGYKFCAKYDKQIASQIHDTFVSGHVISTLYKMQSGGFVEEVKPFVNDKITWIRNKAKRYIAKYDVK